MRSTQRKIRKEIEKRGKETKRVKNPDQELNIFFARQRSAENGTGGIAKLNK